jgi:hypothetical protein
MPRKDRLRASGAGKYELTRRVTMKQPLIRLFAPLILAILTSTASAADAHTAGQLSRAGWDCFPAGPYGWIHCLDIDRIVRGSPSVPVKVFSVDGSDFLGTELLLHEDVYAGQSCPQDALDLWGPSADAPGYFACHHFLTAH